MKRYIPVFCLFVILLSSCTMEKRLYRPGLHIDFSKSQKNSDKSVVVSKSESNKNDSNSFSENNMIASTDKSNSIIIPQLTQLQSIFNSDTCDNIILKNGKEISAKVIEVGVKEIKYKKCPDNNDPLYSIKKSDVFMIKYPDGTKDIMPEEKVKEESPFDEEEVALLNKVLKKEKGPKTEGFGVWAFVLSLIGFGIAMWISMISGIAPLAVGLIFGIISLVRIGRHPEKFKRRGFGIVAIIVSVIMIAVIIALLSAL